MRFLYGQGFRPGEVYVENASPVEADVAGCGPLAVRMSNMIQIADESSGHFTSEPAAANTSRSDRPA